jgi:hypothetical protein
MTVIFHAEGGSNPQGEKAGEKYRGPRRKSGAASQRRSSRLTGAGFIH